MQLKTVKFKADDVEGREFRGYAATWDKDRGDDIILKGAFAKTLKERGDRVKILWQHHEPIGRPLEMVEDEKGLFVVGKISKTRTGDEAIELMRDDVIDQMSIGYSVPEDKSDYVGGVRIIRELKLYEFSLVTFPMNENAVITGVKSIAEALRGGVKLDSESIALLKKATDDLKTLISEEPQEKSTLPEFEPSEMQDLKQLFAHFGR